MRIGIDCRMYSINFTGIGRYVYELVHHLAAQKNTNHQFFLFFNEDEYETFKLPADNFHKVKVDAPHYSFKEQWHYNKVLNAKNLDLMHFTHFNAPILYNRPFVVTIHDLTLSFFPGKKLRRWYHRLAYHMTIKHAVTKAKQIIAVSKHTKKDLHKLFTIPEDKSTVVYEGIHKEFFQKKLEQEKALTLEKYGIRSPFFIYTGVWRDHKNLVNLIKAFNILVQDNKVKAQLIITGKDNPVYPEVKEAVEKFGLEGKVVFTGLVPEDELVNLYQAATIYTFPSLYEGFGLPILEAMSCSLPVVASDASSIPEICGEGNAVLFNPKQPQDIAEKIYSVYENKELQEKLIKRGLERIKHFSWTKMAEETLDVYAKALM